MSGFKNFYPILGLPDFSDANAVKAAYRRLAREHHPDLNRDNPQAEETLKNLNAAYETLSDPIKRALHDRQLQLQSSTSSFDPKKPGSRSATEAAKKTPPKGQSPEHGSQKDSPPQPEHRVDVSSASGIPKPPEKGKKAAEPAGNSFSELLDDWLGKGKNSAAQQGKRSTAGSTEPKGEPSASSSEPAPDSSVFESDAIRGMGGARPWESSSGTTQQAAKEKPRRGEDVHVKTLISTTEAVQGVVKTVHVQHLETCRRCSGTGRVNGTACSACYGEKSHTRMRKMDVRIPAGVKTGSRVRVAKEGGRGVAGGDAGDLFLQIEISADPSLRIEGLDVHGELSIPLTDAVLGASIEVTTVSGAVSMSIPPGTQSGRIFRLKELGVKHGLSTGDHFVTITVQIPENLSARERDLYQELARLRGGMGNKKSKA
jgi:DnaJ-class molecular chaperone